MDHQSRSERVRKISPPPGFDPRTVQPVVALSYCHKIPYIRLALKPDYNGAARDLFFFCVAGMFRLIQVLEFTNFRDCSVKYRIPFYAGFI